MQAHLIPGAGLEQQGQDLVTANLEDGWHVQFCADWANKEQQKVTGHSSKYSD